MMGGRAEDHRVPPLVFRGERRAVCRVGRGSMASMRESGRAPATLRVHSARAIFFWHTVTVVTVLYSLMHVTRHSSFFQQRY
jgi:hypothetical protein